MAKDGDKQITKEKVFASQTGEAGVQKSEPQGKELLNLETLIAKYTQDFESIKTRLDSELLSVKRKLASKQKKLEDLQN